MRQYENIRPAIFHPKALKLIRQLSLELRKELGKAIFELQKGSTIGMPFSRPMPNVAIGVEELRIRNKRECLRVFYVRKSKEGILIFHTFTKKTQKTPKFEIEMARQHLKEMQYDKK